MTAKSKTAQVGLDYVPAPPIDGNSFGVTARTHGTGVNTAHSFIARSLFPVERANSEASPWVPTCFRHDVLLPEDAPDACHDPQLLCDMFKRQAMAGLYTLGVIMTLRFAQKDLCHAAFELHRAFAREEFVTKRSLPVVFAMHVPQLSSRIALPHSHLVILARRLDGSHFGDFAKDLFDPQASVGCADAFQKFAKKFR